MRNYFGQTLATLPDNLAYEAALGDHGRSGEQFDIWQAVYGPVGSDGYPAQIFDKSTGVIDHKVAEYWKEHYDLNAILQRDWPTLGPKLQGKIHLYVGSADTYFLNDAVYLMEDFLKTTGTKQGSVPYDGEGEIRRPGGALLERRPNAAQMRSQVTALQHDVSATDHGSDCEDGSARCGRN